MKTKAKSNNFFKSSEEVVSMFLGLLIVVLVISLVVNFFQKNRGKVDLPGVADRNLPTKVEVAKTVEQNGNYKVQIGDSLWKICQQKLGNGDRWPEVAKLNGLANPRILTAGQELKMPREQVSATQTTLSKTTGQTGGEYIVKKGDSLWKISVQVYGDGYQWTKLYRANQKLINDPNNIVMGMKLSL